MLYRGYIIPFIGGFTVLAITLWHQVPRIALIYGTDAGAVTRLWLQRAVMTPTPDSAVAEVWNWQHAVDPAFVHLMTSYRCVVLTVCSVVAGGRI